MLQTHAVVVLVVPCFNEAARLVPAPWLEWLDADPGHRLLFVDDGSEDATRDVLTRLCAQRPTQAFLHALPHNRGKAEAVRQGVLVARQLTPDFIGYWDADLATPLEEADAMLAHLAAHPSVQLLLASRVALLGRTIRRHPARHYLGRVFATAASITLQLPVYDTQCGAKLFRPHPAILAAFSTPFDVDWVFDVQLLSRILRRLDASLIHEFPLQTWEDVPGSKVRPIHFLRAARELCIVAADHRRPLAPLPLE